MAESHSNASLGNQPPGHAHLIGIAGAGMKALAEVLLGRNWQVTGCDQNPDPVILRTLQRRGAEVFIGHDAAHLQSSPQIVIASPAIPSDNFERHAAEQLGMRTISYVQAIAELAAEHVKIAVAGTHGKSTTTAMLGEILTAAGRNPTVICGAELLPDSISGKAGTGNDFVWEACEYRRHFLQSEPDVACLLGIEADHFDCFPTLADTLDAYQAFLDRIPATGTLIFPADDPHARTIAANFSGSRFSYSFQKNAADIHSELLPPENGFPKCRIHADDGQAYELTLRVPGEYQLRNALAAAVTARQRGVDWPTITASLKEFRGLRRRFELVGEWNGMPVIDDFAHHPSEIRETLTAARTRYAGQSLLVVFQPHQVSRTQSLLEQFAEALAAADRVWVMPAYAAREQMTTAQQEISQRLVDTICRQGTQAKMISSLDRLRPTIQTDAGLGHVLLTLGAGDLTRMHYEPSH